MLVSFINQSIIINRYTRSTHLTFHNIQVMFYTLYTSTYILLWLLSLLKCASIVGFLLIQQSSVLSVASRADFVVHITLICKHQHSLMHWRNVDSSTSRFELLGMIDGIALCTLTLIHLKQRSPSKIYI